MKLPFEPPVSVGSKNKGGHFASLARVIALSGKDETDRGGTRQGRVVGSRAATICSRVRENPCAPGSSKILRISRKPLIIILVSVLCISKRAIVLWTASIPCKGSPRTSHTFSSYVTTTRHKLNESCKRCATNEETHPIKVKRDPSRSRFSTHSSMEHSSNHRQIDQYPALLS